MAIPEGLPLAVTLSLAFSVKKMLKEMVVKLMEEANEVDEHKGFC